MELFRPLSGLVLFTVERGKITFRCKLKIVALFLLSGSGSQDTEFADSDKVIENQVLVEF
jgi:hypothetical protein